MDSLQTPNESQILSRIIAPDNGHLSCEVAEALLGLSFPDVDLDRMNELADKNRAGTISDAELDEMERYSRVGNLLNLLHSKARRSLRNGQ